MRIHNFSAGPAILPEPVLKEAQEAIWEFGDTGLGLLEMSHRSAAFDAVIDSARGRFRRLLNLDADQEVLFLHGGARTQFYMLPMNLLRGGRATYLDTGNWAYGAAEDARRYGTVDVPFSSRPTYDRVPTQGEWGPLPDDTLYLHYTSNNTVAGSEYHYVPDPGDALLFCDMSSDFLSRPVDGSKFGVIYGGAQKNLGPSGTTVVIFRKSLLEHCDPELPAMLRYGIHVQKGSMYNTPTTFSIWCIERTCAWIEEQGGLEAVAARNQLQAGKLYGVIDGSGFWQGKVEKASRSLMNPTFTTGDADLDMTFVREATDAGLSGLKGHRSVGGLRASLYNAQTDAAVDALVSFMGEFERKHG